MLLQLLEHFRHNLPHEDEHEEEEEEEAEDENNHCSHNEDGGDAVSVLAGVLIGSIMMVVLVQEVWYVVVTVQSQVLEVRFLLRLEPSVHLSMGCWRSQAPSLRPMLMWHLGC